jgi:acyl-CoA thioesterase I
MITLSGDCRMVLDKVFLFGDSVARGIVLDDAGKYEPIRDNFGALAAEKLGVNLVNKARFGCTITKGLDIMRRFFLAKTTGIALLEFGGNDCNFNWEEIAADPEREHLPITPIVEFSRMYGEMIVSLRSSGVIPVIMTLPPLVAERFFDWITRTGLSRAAILSWLGDVQQIFRWHESYDKAVRVIARENSCPLLDIRKAFTENRDYKRYICGDGMHPNREGHKLIEQSLMEYALMA